MCHNHYQCLIIVRHSEALRFQNATEKKKVKAYPGRKLKECIDVGKERKHAFRGQ
jgi:hypothetical protein